MPEGDTSNSGFNPVKINNNVIVTSENNLGFLPASAWTTPPETLIITVSPGLTIANHLRKKTLVIPWKFDRKQIKRVRTALDKFRQKWSNKYLDRINPEDLLTRLNNYNKQQDWSNLLDEADRVHQDNWQQVSISKELKKLAYEGHRLYKNFFPLNSEIQEIINSLRPGSRIDIHWFQLSNSEVPPHVPWELMFQPSVQDLESIDPLGFIGLRYRVNYEIKPYPGSIALGNLQETHQIHCLSWETKLVKETQWHRTYLSGFPNQIFVPSDIVGRREKEQLIEALNTPIYNKINLLYFYCRCNAQSGSDVEFRFGNTSDEEDKITRYELDRDEEIPGNPLVFANACSTLVAESFTINDLEQIFFSRGCRAYLGTESRVPEILASRFAAVFFYFFYRQIAPEPIGIGEAVAQTQLFLWTQYKNIGGLFYTYVGKYDICVATKDELSQSS